jgi:hypothetical protein
MVSAAEAKTGGCLKYGLGGAVAGHFAGGHGMAGAAAGCALGAYRRHQANERGQSAHPATTGSAGGTNNGGSNNRY